MENNLHSPLGRLPWYRERSYRLPASETLILILPFLLTNSLTSFRIHRLLTERTTRTVCN